MNFTEAAETILKDDFLSPVLAAFVFPDFLQRFLFFPVPLFDHSVALEKSIEVSWDSNVQESQKTAADSWIDRDNPLRASFSTSWNPGADGPALFMNTTEVGCGRGRVISLLAIGSRDIPSVPLATTKLDDGSPTAGIDISMSTAAVLSARFPWLTPPGWFYETRISPADCGPPNALLQEKIHLVDGGYIDNSGTNTALGIINDVQRAAQEMKRGLKINLIVLTSRGFVHSRSFQGDYLAPFQTLLSTRAARGEIAIEEAEFRFQSKQPSMKSETSNISLTKFELQGFGYELPLGWQLSPVTRLLILGQNGDPRRCPAIEKRGRGLTEQYDCSTSGIYSEMNK